MNKKYYQLQIILFLLIPMVLGGSLNQLYSQEKALQDRWKLGPNGEIIWQITDNSSLPHYDHIEMAGQSVDVILEWGINTTGNFEVDRLIRWPMLRTVPDDTHASFTRSISDREAFFPKIEGEILSEGKVKRISIHGSLSVLTEHDEGIEIMRTFFPSVVSPAIFETFRIRNDTESTMRISVPSWKETEVTASDEGVFGSYVVEQFVIGEGDFHLATGETLEYAIVYAARKKSDAPYFGNFSAEWAARTDFMKQTAKNLVLKTPDPVLNRLFDFSKIRAAESIFSTRGGLMHGPGGYNKYLAAIWANDQAEYINPFFPFLGNPVGNESAINSFRHFAEYTNPEFHPIPSSIVSEGRDYWNGAGDRGDMAMIAYGASRFALASGNKQYGEELWPLITWCLEYLERKELPSGAISSDSDELEGRFPAGNANLATISLYYDALRSASYLSDALGEDEKVGREFREKAKEVKNAIAKNFEATVEGFDTYQYYEGNDELRSWIVLPLIAGIFDRAEGTVDALFSPKLWTDYGLLTKSGTETVWDRSTLYALNGVFQAGYVERGMEKLKNYSRARLLGDHVPYVIEATSEQNQSHLSAESGLYCRIFIEGIFGIRPTGFNSFDCKPRIPENWESASLENIYAFGRKWDIDVINDDKRIAVVIKDEAGKQIYNKKLPKGEIHHIDFGEF